MKRESERLLLLVSRMVRGETRSFSVWVFDWDSSGWLAEGRAHWPSLINATCSLYRGNAKTICGSLSLAKAQVSRVRRK